MARWPQREHSSRCPPSAAVRQRSMAVNNFRCSRFNHERLNSMKFRPALRTKSATSSGGRCISRRDQFWRLASAHPGTRGGTEMKLRKMEVNRGFLQIAMTEQNLNGAQIRSGFEQVRRETVPQGVRMNLQTEPRPFGCFPASLPDHFRVDGRFPRVPPVAGEQPDLRSAPKSAPERSEFLQQLRTKHDISIFAALAALHVNDHPLTIDVADLQTSQLGTSQSGGVERHQEHAVERSGSRIDELGHRSRTEDLGKSENLSRIGCFSNRPGFLERRHEKESKCSSSLVHGV